jgi:hypothetical protein
MKYKGSCHCGIHSYGKAMDPKDNAMAVNIRCIEEIDLQAIPAQRYDGRSL